MTRPDLDLLITLDALLSEGSVARAALRLRLSPSAMSRALARLRRAMGDPLLVRAGRGLVPTPRAIALKERVAALVLEAGAVLRPAESLDLQRLRHRFTLRNREGFVENFGAALLARVEREAPGVRLQFVAKADRDGKALRDGSVDLETGVVGAASSPELRAQALFEDRFVAVVRPDHPLCRQLPTAAGYAAAGHILVSRRGLERGPVDEALSALGLERRIAVGVTSFSEALSLARATRLVATLPDRYTRSLRDGLETMPLPFALPGITVSMLWHPRMDADPAHRWLRGCVLEVCRRQSGTLEK